MSTSFPFLEIARDFGLPYGDVVRFASIHDDSPVNGPHPGIWRHEAIRGRRGAFLYAVHYAILAERERRAANSAPPKVIETSKAAPPSDVTPWAEGRPA